MFEQKFMVCDSKASVGLLKRMSLQPELSIALKLPVLIPLLAHGMERPGESPSIGQSSSLTREAGMQADKIGEKTHD